jgi:hypothetical protein
MQPHINDFLRQAIADGQDLEASFEQLFALAQRQE